MMKFEDFLMQHNEEHQKRLELEEEVAQLQEDLNGEQNLNNVLKCALNRPVLSLLHLPPNLPLHVKVLLEELAMVEEEIVWLQNKVEELKLSLFQEQKNTRVLQTQQPKQQHRKEHVELLLCDMGNQTELTNIRRTSRRRNQEEFRKQKMIRERTSSLGSTTEFQRMSSTSSNEETTEKLCVGGSRIPIPLGMGTGNEEPNKLSEELIKCLISIFLKLNQARMDNEGSATVPKLTLSCMNRKSFKNKTSFTCKAPILIFDNSTSHQDDPYGILPDYYYNGIVSDVGPYKNFIQITRSSVDTSRVSECVPAIRKLRVLMHKLSKVDLTFLTYKQKLAFWINIYNACIKHAFLQHGFPSTQEKLLALMNKAALNVGGIVLNALAIEHFILRHPCDSRYGPTDEKEMLLRHAYGLGYPEPNVTFALCRGSWSSPALRVYSADEVVNELGRAKVEYLEASVGVTSKKKIVVPKLLQWHMRDFADDMELLLEWIYSQLPPSGALLKRLIMECLNGERKSPITKIVEIQPYKSEFRYLLPL